MGPLCSAEVREDLFNSLGFDARERQEYMSIVVEVGGHMAEQGVGPDWLALAVDWHSAH